MVQIESRLAPGLMHPALIDSQDRIRLLQQQQLKIKYEMCYAAPRSLLFLFLIKDQRREE